MVIGARIRTIRKETGVSQRWMAQRLDTDQATVRLIESGKRNLTTLELHRIADILGVNIASLVTDDAPTLPVSKVRQGDMDFIAWARRVANSYLAMRNRAQELRLC